MARKRTIGPERVADLLVDSAHVLKIMARYREAEERLERARMTALAGSDPGRALRAEAELAALCYIRGALDRGLEIAERVAAADGGETAESRASAWNTQGNIHLRRCNFEAAEHCFRQALEHYQRLGQETSVGTLKNNLANISNVRGEYRPALELYRQALEIFERRGDAFRTAHVLHAISQMHLSLQEFARARACLARSLELRQRIQDYRGIANGLLVLIGLETDLRDFGAGSEHLRQADEVIEERGLTDPHLVAYRHGTAGILFFNTGEHSRAEECFLALIAISERMGFAEFLAGGFNWLGKNRVYRDRTPAGLEDIGRGIGLAEGGNLPYEEKNGWSYLAECRLLLGDRSGAAEAAGRYAEAAVGQGMPREEAERAARKLAGND